MVQLRHFKLEIAECFIRNPIYYPHNKITCEYMPEKSPSMFLKLIYRDSHFEQTIFTDQEGKFLSWHVLDNTHFTFIPKFHIKNIYVDRDRCTFRMEILSAVVTSIKPLNEVTLQTTTLNSSELCYKTSY